MIVIILKYRKPFSNNTTTVHTFDVRITKVDLVSFYFSSYFFNFILYSFLFWNLELEFNINYKSPSQTVTL